MNPLDTLQQRYPEADFSIYFSFLDACKSTRKEKGKTQIHHICPRKQFPEHVNCLENLQVLEFDEHGFAHRLLEAAASDIRSPRTAFLKAQLESASRGGRISASLHKENGTGIFALGNCAKGGLAAFEKGVGVFAPENLGKGNLTNKKNGTGVYSAEVRAVGASLGGQVGGRVCKEKKTGIFALENIGKGGRICKENGTGIFGLTPEQRKAASLKGNLINKENGTGVYAMSFEQHQAHGIKGANTCKEKGVGIFNQTTEQLSENGKRTQSLYPGKANHYRHHVRRGEKKFDCKWCGEGLGFSKDSHA
jgi:hypothetical protein